MSSRGLAEAKPPDSKLPSGEHSTVKSFRVALVNPVAYPRQATRASSYVTES